MPDMTGGTCFANRVAVSLASGRLPGRAFVAIVLVALTTACGGVDSALTRAALTEALEARPRTASVRRVWSDVRRFYETGEHRLQWTSGRRVSRAQAVLDEAASHGLDPADYDAAGIARAWTDIEESDAEEAARAKALAAFDVRVTTALLSLANDVTYGRVRPETINPRWVSHRAKRDLAAMLTKADGRFDGWLDGLAPTHEGYRRLRATLADVRRDAEPDETLLARVGANLDRWRWLPDDLGARHVWVNIPSFTLEVRDAGRTALAMPVVVGKAAGQQTPVFSAPMKTVAFSPYWNIPASIANAETLPAIAGDPDYLDDQRIEVVRRSDTSAGPIDPDDINWDDEDVTRDLLFRQRPGAGNALGKVKFLLPNRHAVYLHDTPSTSLFARDARAFSHGCVRVAEPAELARYVLADQPEWTPARIDAAMRSSRERQVALSSPLPVHLVYFTTVSTPEGRLDVLGDVYGLDARHRRLESRIR
jgi:murein L,D-transpeptidase YcbB/YkuD